MKSAPVKRLKQNSRDRAPLALSSAALGPPQSDQRLTPVASFCVGQHAGDESRSPGESFSSDAPPNASFELALAAASSPPAASVVVSHNKDQQAEEGGLVPAAVLAEAQDTITLLMDEIRRLNETIDEFHTMRTSPTVGVAASRHVHEPQDQSQSGLAQMSSSSALLVKEDAVENHSECCKSAGSGELERAKRTIQMRNKAIQQLQRQLADSTAKQDALVKSLQERDVEIEKLKHRESILARELQSLRKDKDAGSLQVQALKRSQQETVHYFIQILEQWKLAESQEVHRTSH